MRRDCDLHAPRDAELDRAGGRLRNLRRGLRDLVGFHLLEGPGDEGHAAGGDHRVLRRRSQSSQERVDGDGNGSRPPSVLTWRWRILSIRSLYHRVFVRDKGLIIGSRLMAVGISIFFGVFNFL